MNTYTAPKQETKKSLLQQLAEIKFDFPINDRSAVSYIPFFGFLTILGVLYIANTYYADNMVRKINAMEKEVEEYRVDYSAYKYEYMLKSKHNEIHRKVKRLGLIEKDQPVYRISTQKK
jgi:hypothetical protein